MLEYAYKLESFEFLDDLFESQSLEDFYDRLARILALQILNRGRKGFHRAYLGKKERLPYVRGRLNVREFARTPWDVNLVCHYQEHTADIEDNQILAWTLFVIARSGLLREGTSAMIRQAYRSLQGLVTLRPFGPSDCVGRSYSRLNNDYQTMHALCRFFLEHSGPRHEMGDRTMLSFLVDMARLYERFVAEWLKAHAPQDTFIKAKELVHFGGNAPSFEIDLVLHDTATTEALYVMDTKYKAASAPSSDDLAQVVAYAEAKGCGEAVLVYPNLLSKPLDTELGGIRVRSLVFSLSGDLEQAGRAFVQDVL